MSESIFQFVVIDNGECALTLSVNSGINECLSERLQSLAKTTRAYWGELLIEVIPGYQSLTLWFDITAPGFDMAANKAQFEAATRRCFSQFQHAAGCASQLIEIPVCYQEPYAPDLPDLASACGLTTEQVVVRHSDPEYLVHMLGFMPGFLYLGGLDSSLHCPRKSVPSVQVPSGSVAIGGEQTGIYPVASPGGWHVIGQTPLSLFDAKRQPPNLAHPMDRVKFIPVSAAEFKQLQILQEN